MGQVIVTKAQDGETLTLRVGDSLLLQLPENPSTGYRWAFAAIDESLLAVEDPRYHAGEGSVGSAGVAVWTLRARASGKSRLVLKYWRHWEGDRSVIDRFSVTLDIRP
jgi:inhibitor of cysteine peptidase